MDSPRSRPGSSERGGLDPDALAVVAQRHLQALLDEKGSIEPADRRALAESELRPPIKSGRKDVVEK